jgi:hypothetical protein
MGGAAATIVSILSPCDSLSRFVFNSCDLKAQCCYNFCDVTCRTDLVPLEHEDSEYELDVADIVHVKKS